MFGVLRPEACAPIAREPNLKMVLTSLGSLWIVNRTTDAIELQAGELFGFNTGAYVEVQSGLSHYFPHSNAACLFLISYIVCV